MIGRGMGETVVEFVLPDESISPITEVIDLVEKPPWGCPRPLEAELCGNLVVTEDGGDIARRVTIGDSPAGVQKEEKGHDDPEDDHVGHPPVQPAFDTATGALRGREPRRWRGVASWERARTTHGFDLNTAGRCDSFLARTSSTASMSTCILFNGPDIWRRT